MLTVTELQSLLQDLKRRESELDDIEVKKAVGGTPRIFETLSSFANRPGGGLIIFGIDNDTLEPVGVGNLDELQRDIANRAAEMEPPLRVRMRSFDLEGKVVLVVEVPEVDAQQKPCYYRPAGLHGGAYVRVGDGDRRMTDYEIYAMKSSRGPVNDDRQAVPGASMTDLDADAVAQYLARLRASKPEAKYLHGNQEQVMRTLGILAPGTRKAVPTLAGLLVFGRYPQQFYPELIIALTAESVGAELAGQRFTINAKAEGNIMDMLNQAIGWLSRNLRYRTLVTGLVHQDIPEYPLDALREAIVNAVAHRDYGQYAIGTQVQVRLFADRVEIQNPGGLYGPVTLDRLGEPGLQSARNPLLVRFLEDLGPMENRGSGIRAMLRSLRLAHLEPPQFDDQRTSFKVTFYNHTLLSQEVLTWLEQYAGLTQLNDRQRYALAYLRQRGRVANRDYQLLNAVDARTAARELRSLVEAGLLATVGTRGGTRYELVSTRMVSEPKLPFESDQVAGMRKTQRAVYELVAQHGPISAAEIASQLHLKRSTANYQIKRLLDAGLIAPTEQRRQSGRQAYVLAGRTDRRVWR